MRSSLQLTFYLQSFANMTDAANLSFLSYTHSHTLRQASTQTPVIWQNSISGFKVPPMAPRFGPTRLNVTRTQSRDGDGSLGATVKNVAQTSTAGARATRTNSYA